MLGSRFSLKVNVFHDYIYILSQDVLSFLENRKENRSWYKGSRIAVTVSTIPFSFDE